MEVGKLRKKISEFESRQIEFRRDFTKMRFFLFKCKKPYEYLSQANVLINDMEKEMKSLLVNNKWYARSNESFHEFASCLGFGHSV